MFNHRYQLPANDASFDLLPDEILLQLFKPLSAKDLLQLRLVNGRAHALVSAMFKEKFKQYFPNHYQALSTKENVDYCREFHKVYLSLPEKLQALLILIANNDQIKLAERKQEFTDAINDFDSEVLHCAQVIGNQSVLNYFYECVKEFYQNADGSLDLNKLDYFGSGRNLLYWMIACHQDCELINACYPNYVEGLFKVGYRLRAERFAQNNYFSFADLAVQFGHVALTNKILNQIQPYQSELNDFDAKVSDIASAKRESIDETILPIRDFLNWAINAACNEGHMAIVQALFNFVPSYFLYRPRFVEFFQSFLVSPFTRAARGGHAHLLQFLSSNESIIHANVSKDEIKEHYIKVFSAAITCKTTAAIQLEMIKTLLETKPDFDLPNVPHAHKLPLFIAVEQHNAAVSEFLFDKTTLNREGKAKLRKLIVEKNNVALLAAILPKMLKGQTNGGKYQICNLLFDEMLTCSNDLYVYDPRLTKPRLALINHLVNHMHLALTDAKQDKAREILDFLQQAFDLDIRKKTQGIFSSADKRINEDQIPAALAFLGATIFEGLLPVENELLRKYQQQVAENQELLNKGYLGKIYNGQTTIKKQDDGHKNVCTIQ